MRIPQTPAVVILMVWTLTSTLLCAGCSGRSDAAAETTHRVETPRYEMHIKVPPIEPRIDSLWLAAQTSIKLDIPICHLVPDYSFEVKTNFRSLQVDDQAPLEISVCVVQTFGCQRDRAHFVLVDQRLGAC